MDYAMDGAAQVVAGPHGHSLFASYGNFSVFIGTHCDSCLSDVVTLRIGHTPNVSAFLCGECLTSINWSDLTVDWFEHLDRNPVEDLEPFWLEERAARWSEPTDGLKDDPFVTIFISRLESLRWRTAEVE